MQCKDMDDRKMTAEGARALWLREWRRLGCRATCSSPTCGARSARG